MTNEETSEYLRLRCVDAGGGCLHWYTKAKTENRKRHPMFRFPGDRKPVLARRALYEAERGTIRPGYYLVPSCEDEYCIEPTHQKQVTRLEASDIGGKAAANSPTRGPKLRATRLAKGLAKLTPEVASQVRSSEETNRAAARRLGVSEKAISDVRLGKTWPEVTGNVFSGLGAR